MNRRCCAWPILFGCVLCAASYAAKQPLPDTWYVKQAEVRFQVERDDTFAPVPDVFLSDLKPAKGSSPGYRVRFCRKDSRSYVRVDGKLYTHAIGTRTPATFVFDISRKYKRFVARIGIEDRAPADYWSKFEVIALGRTLFRSERLYRHSAAVDINVEIPTGAPKITLKTIGKNDPRHRVATWVNAGMLLKDSFPSVSSVNICAPGIGDKEMDALVYDPVGKRVGSKVLSSQPGKPMEVLFDSSGKYAAYEIYLVKGKTAKTFRGWQPRAGVVLETRYVEKGKMSKKGDEYEVLKRAWNGRARPVGCSLVDNIHHGYPVHSLDASSAQKTENLVGLYRYTGYFRAARAGKHTFATVSRWGSHILIDGKPVISWPGKHGKSEGVRGQKSGTVQLRAGVHKLEYMNYYPWGKMFTMAAWQDAAGLLKVMTRGDFLPIGRFKVSSISYRQPGAGRGSFAWQSTDDCRLVGLKASLIAMRFSAIEEHSPVKYEYRWIFNDGSAMKGQAVDKVFFKPGPRLVKMEISRNGRVHGVVEETVQVEAVQDKLQADPRDFELFNRAVVRADLRRVPINDVAELYRYADGAYLPEIKKRATNALTARMDELLKDKNSRFFCLKLAGELCSAPLQQYDSAIDLFSRLEKNQKQGSWIWCAALVARADLLLRVRGQAREALVILDKLAKGSKLAGVGKTRVMLLRAQALIVLDRMSEAESLLVGLVGESDAAKVKQRDIRHESMLRHARQLADCRDDAAQLGYGMKKLDAILYENPVKLLDPPLNLVRIDLHLARREYHIAYNLTQCLKRLDLNGFDRPEVLAREVVALCGTGSLERSRKVYAIIRENYPYSPALVAAKQAIIDAVKAGGNLPVN
jgi:NPCBM/NEW2 domain